MICIQLTQAVQYQLTDLGTLGFPHSVATSINNSGQVVGYSKNEGGSQRAFLYSNGSMQDLGTLGDPATGADSYAYGINNSGQVVGKTSVIAGGMTYHAFVYSNGSMQDLGTLGGNQSTALAINDSGITVGSASTYSGAGSAFLYQNCSMQGIGQVLGGNSARGINNSGQIIVASEATGNWRSAIYSNGVTQDLGTLGGRYCMATGINDLGQVTGNAETSNGQSHAFFYSNGVTIDLGVGTANYGSYGLGLNNLGEVVGTSISPDGGPHYAFVYSNGLLVDLNSYVDPATKWNLEEAMDINDSGQIVGYGNIEGQYGTRAFLLTPIPEPASLILFCLGSLGVLRRRR